MNIGMFGKRFQKNFYFYLFIAPAFILYAIFFLFPFFQGIEYSFLNWNGLDPEIPNQMDIFEFDTLVNYNVPLYYSSEEFEKNILLSINLINDRMLLNSYYKLQPVRKEYELKKYLDGDSGIRPIELNDIKQIVFILSSIKKHNSLSEKDKLFLYKHYELFGSNRRLIPKTSYFNRSKIRKFFASIGYHNIRNIGLDNFAKLFSDKKFKEVIKFTLFYTFLNVTLINIIALLLAMALDTQIRARNTLRSLFFLPNILSLIIVAYIWSFIYKEGFSALYSLTNLELFNLNWLTSIEKAPWAVVLTSVWQGIGYIMVIYLAGLQTIPQEILEVASIDGAGGFKKFTSIIVPLLLPSITICFFITLTNSLKTFEVMLALTDGSFNTTSFVLNVYQEAFRRNRVGYSTAQAIILMIVIMTISTIQLSIMKKRELEY